MNMKNVTILDHPLIQHKISILRNKNTGTNEFRSLTDEIAMLMGYEALRDLPLEDQAVHKSVGAFVDPEHRQKAKAANCYQRRTGTFLPQQKEFFTPAFREDFKSRPYYFEWSDAFLSQEDLLKEYLCSELQLFFKDDSKTRK